MRGLLPQVFLEQRQLWELIAAVSKERARASQLRIRKGQGRLEGMEVARELLVTEKRCLEGHMMEKRGCNRCLLVNRQK
jgi:hypothetical protein